MHPLAAVFVAVALVCFLCGAIGLTAKVNWDAAGKASVLAAALAQWAPWPGGR